MESLGSLLSLHILFSSVPAAKGRVRTRVSSTSNEQRHYLSLDGGVEEEEEEEAWQEVFTHTHTLFSSPSECNAPLE